MGGASHACELFIHAEVVLEGDGGVGYGLLLDLEALLGLDGLVEAVRVAPALHEAAVNSSTMMTLPSRTTYSRSRR